MVYKSQFALVLEGLAMEDVDIFWCILCQFGIFNGHLVYFSPSCTKKNLATL
jgi:hypothetical protein